MEEEKFNSIIYDATGLVVNDGKVVIDEYVPDELVSELLSNRIDKWELVDLMARDYLYEDVLMHDNGLGIDDDTALSNYLFNLDVSLSDRVMDDSRYKVSVYVDVTKHYSWRLDGIPEDSLDASTGVGLIAAQQGILDELNRCLECELKDEEYETTEQVRSYVDEFRNLGPEASCMTLCCKMSLRDILAIREFRECEPAGSLVFDKDSLCGLFDYSCGGGSTFDIVNTKDIVIRIGDIFDVDNFKGDGKYGYCVGDSFGLTTSRVMPVRSIR